jgi:hypothetical protein
MCEGNAGGGGWPYGRGMIEEPRLRLLGMPGGRLAGGRLYAALAGEVEERQ